MSGPCSPTFDNLAETVGGFGCDTAQPFVQLRAPWNLSNWTLPVIEAVMVVGAVFALFHALRRWRREADPTVISLWGASVVYLLIMEPPLYFPEEFGLEDAVGLTFVHNVFSVQFLYDRLPLYIIALYPAMITLAYEVVRCLGVFQRRGLVVGAAATGFVHMCFYEVFDQLGPQLRWWIWNPEARSSQPAIGAVPMTSVVLFAALQPFVLVLLVRWFVGRPVDRGTHLHGWGLAGRAIAAGALVPVLALICGMPVSAFGGDEPNRTAQAVVLWTQLGIVGIVAVIALLEGWRQLRSDGGSPHRSGQIYVLRHGAAFLVVLGVLWMAALPAYFGAHDGMTSDGTPIGNVVFAALCFLGAGGAVALVMTSTRLADRPATRRGSETLKVP